MFNGGEGRGGLGEIYLIARAPRRETLDAGVSQVTLVFVPSLTWRFMTLRPTDAKFYWSFVC